MSYPIEKLENQMIDLIDEVYANSGLGRWFGKGGVGSSSGGGWDRYNSSGKKAGKCGDAKKGSSYSACLGKKYVARLRSKGGKKAIANWVKRKKSTQNKAGRGEKGSGGKGKAPVKVSYKEQLCEIFIINHRISPNCCITKTSCIALHRTKPNCYIIITSFI